MKKLFILLAALSLLMSACASENSGGIPITVYRSPT
ncbi:MAG: hypothetical protein CNIPEHKO_00083 [Anaerolineales bacterium]|jgi:hypothetical protein|nr:hypothetical protein [Anaerolineales bacterium]